MNPNVDPTKRTTPQANTPPEKNIKTNGSQRITSVRVSGYLKSEVKDLRSEVKDIDMPQYNAVNANLEHMIKRKSEFTFVSGVIGATSAGLGAGSYFIPWYLTMLRFLASLFSVFFGVNEILRTRNEDKVLLDAVVKYKENLENIKNNNNDSCLCEMLSFCIGSIVQNNNSKGIELLSDLPRIMQKYIKLKKKEDEEKSKNVGKSQGVGKSQDVGSEITNTIKRCNTWGKKFPGSAKNVKDVILAYMISMYYNNRNEYKGIDGIVEESLFNGIENQGIQNICLGLTNFEFALYKNEGIQSASSKLGKSIEDYHNEIIGTSKCYAAARAASLAVNFGTAIASMTLNMLNTNDVEMTIEEPQLIVSASSKENAIIKSQGNTNVIYQVEGTNEYYYNGIAVTKDSNGIWQYDENYIGSVKNPQSYVYSSTTNPDTPAAVCAKNPNKLIKYTGADGQVKYYYNGAEVTKGSDGNYYKVIVASGAMTGKVNVVDGQGNIISGEVVLTPTTNIDTTQYPFTSGTIYYEPAQGTLSQIEGNRYLYTASDGNKYEVIKNPNGMLYRLDGQSLAIQYNIYPSGNITEQTVAGAQSSSISKTNTVFIDSKTQKKYFNGKEVQGSVDGGYQIVLRPSMGENTTQYTTAEDAIKGSKGNTNTVYVVGSRKYIDGREVTGDVDHGYTYNGINNPSKSINVDTGGLDASKNNPNTMVTDKSTGKLYYNGYEMAKDSVGTYQYKESIAVDRPYKPYNVTPIVSSNSVTVNGVKYTLQDGKYKSSDDKEIDSSTVGLMQKQVTSETYDPISNQVIERTAKVELSENGVKSEVVATMDSNGDYTVKDESGNIYYPKSDGTYYNPKTGKVISGGNIEIIKNKFSSSSSTTNNTAEVAYDPILLPDGKALTVDSDDQFTDALSQILDNKSKYKGDLTFDDQLGNLLESKHFQSLPEDKKRLLLQTAFKKKVFGRQEGEDIAGVINKYITGGGATSGSYQVQNVPNSGGVNVATLYKITIPNAATNSVQSVTGFTPSDPKTTSVGATTQDKPGVYETQYGYGNIATNPQTYLDPVAALASLYTLRGGYVKTNVTGSKSTDEDKKNTNEHGRPRVEVETSFGSGEVKNGNGRMRKDGNGDKKSVSRL
ncbi:hypothetical protein [Candidatus Deianiraea vastatrix]|nr:hypothetical protein [Candidatus Deianiraea vastatrix]